VLKILQHDKIWGDNPLLQILEGGLPSPLIYAHGYCLHPLDLSGVHGSFQGRLYDGAAVNCSYHYCYYCSHVLLCTYTIHTFS